MIVFCRRIIDLADPPRPPRRFNGNTEQLYRAGDTLKYTRRSKTTSQLLVMQFAQVQTNTEFIALPFASDFFQPLSNSTSILAHRTRRRVYAHIVERVRRLSFVRLNLSVDNATRGRVGIIKKFHRMGRRFNDDQLEAMGKARTQRSQRPSGGLSRSGQIKEPR